MNGIKLVKASYPHYPQARANELQKSTSQIRLQALYYLLVRRGFAERFYQAEMVGRHCEIARPFLFVLKLQMSADVDSPTTELAPDGTGDKLSI